MKLLHITGPRDDIDRVMDTYLSKYEIHFENAAASLGSLVDVRPFAGTNVYKEAFSKAKKMWEYIKGEPTAGMEKMRPKEAEHIIEATYGLSEEIMRRQEELRLKRLQITELMAQLEPFRRLDYEFRRILEFHYIAFRMGRISRDDYQKMENYIHETDHALFYECHSDENYVWGAYFVPAVYKSEVDAVCMSFHFERVYIPASFDGTPDSAYLEAERALRENEKESEALRTKLRESLNRHRRKLAGAYFCLERYCQNYDVRKYAVCTKQQKDMEDGGVGEYYILYGWMSERDADQFEQEVAKDGQIHVIEEAWDGHISGAVPPTKLKNPGIFRPFEMFVEMYGLPAYNEMDPTIFIALTYTLMFGIMFGDVGQGLVLAAGGLLLYRIKHMNLAAIVSLAGVWSTVFGFLYGSIFGFEEILHPIWMRPMENLMTTLMLAIGFGMFLILVAMVLNLINAVRAGQTGRLLFDQSGIAGILCYGFVVFCVALYATGHALPATGLIAAFLILPLIAIFLKEPLSHLVEKKGHLFPEGSKVMFFVEALVELFDVVLSYATNSISFVRVGAFALSHAGMMGVVLTLAGYESGSPNMVVIVLGNIVVTALEGLIVGIQVLRLEYYEMFSRFYRGTGRPFKGFFASK